MQSGNWMSKLWSRFRAGVIQDVPPSLEECESCREVNCTQARWLSCARRLAAEAEHDGSSNRFMPSTTGRTDEMPCQSDANSPNAHPGEAETSECCEQRKRISSSGD